MDYIGVWENKEIEQIIKISKSQLSDEYKFQYYNKEKKSFEEDFDLVDIYNNNDNTAFLQNKTKGFRLLVKILSSNCIQIGNILYKIST